MQRLEFALGRTALVYGLRGLGLRSGDVILVPDFLCDVVWLAVDKVNLRVATYPVTDDLTPDWDALTTRVRGRVRALLMVHYFGQPQEIDRYRSVCNENGLWLVEDNAHGYAGAWHGRLLGTLGDVGFASPRKIVGTASGGVLYHKLGDTAQPPDMRDMPMFPATHPLQLAKTALRRLPKIKSRVKGLMELSKDWSDPRVFREREKPDYAIDPRSSRLIASADWRAIAHQRRSEWFRWSEFALQHELVPAFSAVHSESCPWALPVYAKDLDERNRWLSWGARRGVTLFPWPSLPDEVINDCGSALSRWKRLVCFSLDQARSDAT